jgi:TRAP-type uncharacterized transport system substrate-binding protein
MCRLLAFFVVLLLLAPPSTVAQSPSAAEARARAARPSIKIITGGIEYVENTYLVLAGELAAVLDKRPDLRVLPIMGYGAVQNLEDILFLQGIDVGMLHSDIPAYLKLTKQYPGFEGRLTFIVRLYDEPFHVLARRDIATVQDLNGQKVVVGAPGTGSDLSARTLMKLLDVKPEYVHAEWRAGVDLLRSGGAVAMIYPTRKVSSFLRGLEGVERLHFLPLTGTPATQKISSSGRAPGRGKRNTTGAVRKASLVGPWFRSIAAVGERAALGRGRGSALVETATVAISLSCGHPPSGLQASLRKTHPA